MDTRLLLRTEPYADLDLEQLDGTSVDHSRLFVGETTYLAVTAHGTTDSTQFSIACYFIAYKAPLQQMAHKEDARRVHMPHTEAFCSLLFFKALCYAHIGTWWVAISVAPIHLESLSKHHFASLGGTLSLITKKLC